MDPKYTTREQWLTAAAQELDKLLQGVGVGVNVPAHYVSVGFPKAHGGRGRAIGQCWDGSSSRDGRPHLFICPTLGEDRALDVLLHELIHAGVGCKAGHRGAFVKTAKKAGLVKPWTATTPGDELKPKLAAIAERLGPYPHSPMSLPVRGTKGSRLRLWKCSCGVKVRVAKDDFDATCNLCEQPFESDQ